MLLDQGEKIHVIERRMFESDVRRHFVGTVERLNDDTMRASGYTFVLEVPKNEFVRRTSKRTRIYPIADARLILNVLPTSTQIDRVRYETVDGHLCVVDGGDLRLDIQEFSARR